LSASFLSPSQLRKYTETEDLNSNQIIKLSEQQRALLKELQALITKSLKEIKTAYKKPGPEIEVTQRRWEEMKKLVADTEAWNSIKEDSSGSQSSVNGGTAN
jgi:hypothetical protein